MSSRPISDVLPLVEKLDRRVQDTIVNPEAVPDELERLAQEFTTDEPLSAEELLSEYAFFLMLSEQPGESDVITRTRTYVLNQYPPTE